MTNIHLRCANFGQERSCVGAGCSYSNHENILSLVLGRILELLGMKYISGENLNPPHFRLVLHVVDTSCDNDTVEDAASLKTCLDVFGEHSPFILSFGTLNMLDRRRELNIR